MTPLENSPQKTMATMIALLKIWPRVHREAVQAFIAVSIKNMQVKLL